LIKHDDNLKQQKIHIRVIRQKVSQGQLSHTGYQMHTSIRLKNIL